MTTDNESRVVGWKLAKRVANSRLYDELNDLELAECDELIARGNGSEESPDQRSPDGVTCRLSRCLYQGDCARIQYCQSVIFQTNGYRHFIQSDLIPALKKILAATGAQGDVEQLRSELDALMQRAARTV